MRSMKFDPGMSKWMELRPTLPMNFDINIIMDPKTPDFTMLIELLKHSDANYNFFAASKLKSIKELLSLAGQEK